MHVDGAQKRVRGGDEVERVQREVGDAVVLADDLDRVELGVGRRGAVEGHVEDRDVEAGEPGGKAAVGQVGVTDQHEVDVGGLGPLRVLLGQLALLDVRDDRALRVAEDHQSLVGVCGYRILQVGDPAPHRLVEGEIEEPRELPQRLIRPRRTIKPPDALGSGHEPTRRPTPVMGHASMGAVTAMYSMVSPG